MNFHVFELVGETFQAHPSGLLWWPSERLLAVSDLHLGKAERLARRGGALLPPYETQDTLNRLETEILRLNPATVISVGDSFDDLTAADQIESEITERLARLAAGRRWIWIAGNHDPGPVQLPGSHLSELQMRGLNFRHIAASDGADISGHYHPKARLWVKGQSISRACFLIDRHRIILPAFGTYTGGLRIDDPTFDSLVSETAIAVLTGKRALAVPRAAAFA